MGGKNKREAEQFIGKRVFDQPGYVRKYFQRTRRRNNKKHRKLHHNQGKTNNYNE